jgi:general secretion pathway protein E
MSAHGFPVSRSMEVTVSHLGDLLQQAGFVDEKQRTEIENVNRQHLSAVKSTPRGEDVPSVFKAVAAMNLTDASGAGTRIDEFLLARLIAEEAGVPFFKIDPLKLDIEFIETKISRPFARKHRMIPLHMKDGKLRVAVVNPFDAPSIESYRAMTQLDLDLVVSAEADVMSVINELR